MRMRTAKSCRPLSRHSRLFLAVVLTASACDDSTGPVGGTGVMFDAGGQPFAAVGDLMIDIEGRIVENADWAVAADPDSVAGVTIVAFQQSETAGEGSLFVLQLQPAHSGAFTPCGPDEACRGRLFRGWRNDGTGYDEWFEIISGTVNVEHLGGIRISGTFNVTLRSAGGVGDVAFTIDGGLFDVPIDDRAGGVLCGVPPITACISEPIEGS